jgi:hypothetical protein
MEQNNSQPFTDWSERGGGGRIVGEVVADHIFRGA